MLIVLKDTEYAFSAANKTITLIAPYTTPSLGQIMSIINLTTGEEIYLSQKRVHRISIAAAVITHTYDNSHHADTDQLQIIVDALFGVTDSRELINVVNETTKRTVNGAAFPTGPWKEAEYFFDLTSFTETAAANPVTVDVKIETYDPATGKWRDGVVFQQKSCAASGSVTTQEYKRLTGNLGVQQRVTYTTAGAGTIGDCDFKVGVIYKR